MKYKQLEQMRSYAWSYFSYHAEQRIKTFHFYIVMITAIIGGGSVLIAKSTQVQVPMVILGFLMILVSLIFERLDHRNRGLVQVGAAALKKIERMHRHRKTDKKTPSVLDLLSYEESFNKKNNQNSYTQALSFSFNLFAILGILWVFYFLYPNAFILQPESRNSVVAAVSERR